MKIFLDTNILVAAYATQGSCNELLKHCLVHHTIYISTFVLKELKEKLTKKIKLTKIEADVIVDYLGRYCVVAKEEKILHVCRDRDDDHILAAADYAQADYIITGDKDLLILKSYKNVQIISPADFWKITV